MNSIIIFLRVSMKHSHLHCLRVSEAVLQFFREKAKLPPNTKVQICEEITPHKIERIPIVGDPLKEVSKIEDLF